MFYIAQPIIILLNSVLKQKLFLRRQIYPSEDWRTCLVIKLTNCGINNNMFYKAHTINIKSVLKQTSKAGKYNKQIQLNVKFYKYEIDELHFKRHRKTNYKEVHIQFAKMPLIHYIRTYMFIGMKQTNILTALNIKWKL